MLQLGGDRAVFSYDFSGSANIAHASGMLDITTSRTRRNPLGLRNNFNCPECSKCVQKLLFVTDKWACRLCHDLVYLSQRLGDVNNKIHGRDALLAVLQQVPPDHQRKRWFYNLQRHLDRINRELAAAGFSALPQELLYRTYEHWLAPSEVKEAGSESGRAVALLAHDAEADHTMGLAFFLPKRPALEPVLACELIGSIILDRPLQSSLSQFKADRAEQLRHNLLHDGGGARMVRSNEFTSLLAQRFIMRPIVLTSEWSDMIEAIGDGGHREFSATATYVGDRTLWRAGPGAKSYKRELRAILDDETITLCVRSPIWERSDPRADLDAAIAELDHRLSRVEEAFSTFNAMRHHHAARWVRYNMRRMDQPMIRLAKSSSIQPA